MKFLRKIMYDYMSKHFKKIGGENVVVEIDEAKFGRRKYNRGRITEGKWIFGGRE